MADISFYKYLEAAFRYKLKNVAATSFKYLGFDLPYETIIGAKRGIFYYARYGKTALSKTYTRLFPDTKEGNLQMAKKVIENLDRHLDQELDRYFNPVTTPTTPSQQTTAGQPSGEPATTGGGSTDAIGGIRSSSYTAPRHIVIVQQTPPPGGMEGGTGLGTAATNKGLRQEIEGVGAATAKANRIEAAKAETATTPAQPSTTTSVTTPGPAPIKTAQQAITRATATNPGLRFQTGLTNTLKNFGSTSQRFIGTNLGRVFDGLKGMAGNLGGIAGGTGRAITGPGLTGTANMLGRTGLGAINHGGNFLSNLSNTRSRVSRNLASGKSKLTGSKKWIWLIGLLLLVVIFGIIVPSSNPTTPVPTSPTTPTGTTNISQCKFTRAGNPQPIKSSVLVGWISNAAASAGIPAPVLASVAMHEGQNVLATYDDNNPAIKNNQYCSDGPPVCVNMSTNKKQHDGSCSDTEQPPDFKTATAKGLMQLINIYNTDMSEGDFCNIQKNIQRGAQLLRSKIGSGSFNNESDTKRAVCRYFGVDGTTCSYSGNDYAAEVWNDYQNCQTQTPTPISCTTTPTQPPPSSGPWAIGQTNNGKPINAYSLGNGSIHIAIVGGMNGVQEQSGIDMVNAIKESFQAGGAYNIPSDLTVYFVPEITPDSTDGFNSRGQDVNRNFASNSVPGGRWSPIGCSIGRYQTATGSYSTSCQDQTKHTANNYVTSDLFNTYCTIIAPSAPNSTNQFTCAPNKTGSQAFSEPESSAIADFIQNNSIKTVISYRAPYNDVTSSNAPSGQKLAGTDQLANLFASELEINYDQYFTQYPVNGQFMDWLQDQGVVGVEIELPSTSLADNIKTKNLQTIQKALNSLSKTGPGTPTGPGTTCQHPSAPTIADAGLYQGIKDKFGVSMIGFDFTHMRWVWEKLWDLSNTNFVKFINGTVIQNTNSSSSEQVGCPGAAVSVYLGQYDEILFKYALTHELGHVIRNCNPSYVSFYTDHLNAFNREAGVTYYANNAPSCTGSDNTSEDYAEMTALYLNPNANIQMVRCAPSNTKYTNLRTDFPLHYNVARSVQGDY